MRINPAIHLLALLLATGHAGILAVQAGSAQHDHVVAGTEAWEAARQGGFEFSPILSEGHFILTGGRDGQQTELKSCPRAEVACRTEARVVEGSLSVLPPRCTGGCSRDHRFELFAGRRLAPGWSLVRVELAGARWWWERAPAYGSRDASFVVRVRATPGREGRLALSRITLRGPAEVDWRQAFAARGPDRQRAP